MATKISPNKAGLVFGAVLGACHLSWATIVAMGWAQALMDFIFWLHFFKPVLVMEPFSLGRAVGLVVVTAGIGYAIGLLFALLWNRICR